MSKYLSAIAATIFASALVVPTVSHAASTKSAVVSYADLDLTSPAGQARLHTRIASAARAVCDTGDTRDIAEAEEMRRCRAGAMAAAQPAAAAAIEAMNRQPATMKNGGARMASAH